MAVLDTGETKASLVAIRSAPDAHKGSAGQCMHTKERGSVHQRQADEDERGRAHHGAYLSRDSAIGGHQRSSEAIRGHQRSSEAIRGHQRPSEVIRGHQRPSEAIRGHQRPSEVIRGHQRSLEVIPSPTILETKCHPVHAQHSVLDDYRPCSTACRQSRSPVAMAAV
jgi:hypothetical protein